MRLIFAWIGHEFTNLHSVYLKPTVTYIADSTFGVVFVRACARVACARVVCMYACKWHVPFIASRPHSALFAACLGSCPSWPFCLSLPFADPFAVFLLFSASSKGAQSPTVDFVGLVLFGGAAHSTPLPHTHARVPTTPTQTCVNDPTGKQEVVVLDYESFLTVWKKGKFVVEHQLKLWDEAGHYGTWTCGPATRRYIAAGPWTRNSSDE